MEKLTSIEEFTKLINSTEKPIYIFKHSTRCPISAHAFQSFKEFISHHSDITSAYVDVIHERDVSNQIANSSKVTHQSPQVIIFQKAQPVWHASHYSISVEALENQYKNLS